MRIALVLGPGWYPGSPALGPALLKTYLARHGHEARVLDLGPRFRRAASPDFGRRLLSADQSLLESKDYVNGLFRAQAPLVEECLREIVDWGAEAVGLTVYSSTWLFSLELARRIKARRPEIGVILGGPNGVIFTPPESSAINESPDLAHVDALVPGEGELVLRSLLERRRGGSFQPTPGAFVRREGRFVWGGPGPVLEDLDSLPFPDFDGFKAEDYGGARELVTYFSRGCIRKCVFCDVEVYWKGWRNRSGERVMAEVEHLLSRHPEVRDFIFCDPIVNADLKALGRFCELMEAREKGGRPRVEWRGYAVVRKGMSPEYFRLMKRAGCRELWFGIESGSQRVLNAMRKGYQVETAEEVLAAAHQAGIGAMVLLMAGFPTETEEDFEGTLGFIRRNAGRILEVWPSESFTYLGAGTYLQGHAIDVYGVEKNGLHELYWRSQGGRNDYPARLRRFERLCRAALECGIRLSGSAENVRRNRGAMLERYERFELERSRGPARAWRLARLAWRRAASGLGGWASRLVPESPLRPEPGLGWSARWRDVTEAFQGGRCEDAARLLEGLEAGTPRELLPSLYQHLGEAYDALGRREGVVEAADRARRRGSSTPSLEALAERARRLMEWEAALSSASSGRWAEAAGILESLEAAAWPELLPALYEHLAQAYESLGRADAVAAAGERARRRGSCSPLLEAMARRAAWLLGWAAANKAYRAGRMEEAARELEGLRPAAPAELEQALSETLAEAQYALGRLDRVLETARLARSQGRMSPRLEALAALSEDRGRLDEWNLAIEALSSGRWEEAARSLEGLEAGASPGMLPALYEHMAQAYQALDRLAEVRGVGERARRRGAATPGIEERVRQCLWVLRWREALRLLDEGRLAAAARGAPPRTRATASLPIVLKCARSAARKPAFKRPRKAPARST